jgi:hypothetical protein
MARSPVRLLSCRGSSPAREPGRRDASPCGSSRGYGCFQAVAEPEPRCCRGGVRGDMRQVEYDSPEFWVGLHQVPAGTTDVDSQLGAAGVDDSGRFGSGDRGHSVKLGGEGLRFLWCGGIVIEEFRAKRGRGVVLSGPDRLQQLPLRQPVATRVVCGLRRCLTTSAHHMVDSLRTCWTAFRVSGRGSWLASG